MQSKICNIADSSIVNIYAPNWFMPFGAFVLISFSCYNYEV
nr:MAG TPA: hypothetical protein [Caudoviricetes sp.]